MITLRNISYAYNIKNKAVKRLVLNDLSFDIKNGEFVSVLGRSGCGKTTLANILAGYINVEKGKVTINNSETKKPGKNKILVNQENDLFEWMTVWENMRIVNSDNAVIAKYLKLVGLYRFMHYFPKNLSGGMKKRLSLVRALVVNPKFLILDEPFSSLDYHTKEELHLELDKIFALTKKSIFLVTHDIDEAIFLSDRIIVLAGNPATIVYDLKIDFSHPRKLSMKKTKKFLNLKNNIKKIY